MMPLIVDTEIVFLTAQDAGTITDVNAILVTLDDGREFSLVNIDARSPQLAELIADFLLDQEVDGLPTVGT